MAESTKTLVKEEQIENDVLCSRRIASYIKEGWVESLEIQSLEISIATIKPRGILWASLNNEHFVTDVTDDVAEPSADETVETDKCEQIDF